MTPAAARAKWKRLLYKNVETVTLRRTVQGGPAIERDVKARVTGYAPEELAGGIKQGDRKVFILAEDVEKSGFPTPFKIGGADNVVVRGRPMMIGLVDDSTHRHLGVLMAYEIKAVG